MGCSRHSSVVRHVLLCWTHATCMNMNININMHRHAHERQHPFLHPFTSTHPCPSTCTEPPSSTKSGHTYGRPCRSYKQKKVYTAFCEAPWTGSPTLHLLCKQTRTDWRRQFKTQKHPPRPHLHFTQLARHQLVVLVAAIEVTPAVEAPVKAHQRADGRPGTAAQLRHHKLRACVCVCLRFGGARQGRHERTVWQTSRACRPQPLLWLQTPPQSNQLLTAELLVPRTVGAVSRSHESSMVTSTTRMLSGRASRASCHCACGRQVERQGVRTQSLSALLTQPTCECMAASLGDVAHCLPTSYSAYPAAR